MPITSDLIVSPPNLKPGQETAEFSVAMDLPFSVYTGPGGANGKAEVPWISEVTVQELIRMRMADGQARALYRIFVMPIISALKHATFVPPDEEGGEDETKFIEQMFTLPPQAGGMSVTWKRLWSQLCLGIFDSFSVFEQVYKVPDKGPLKGKFVLKKLAHLPPQTVKFLADDHAGFAGVRQKATFNGKLIDITLPREDSFYWAANEEENPLYGVSYFLPAFYHYDKKAKLYYIAHLAAQNRATAGRVGRYPAGASPVEINNFRRAIADFGLASAMTAPSDYEVDELGRNLSNFNFLELLNHHNQQMSKSVLANFLDKDDAGGSTLINFSEANTDMFLLSIASVMDEMASAFNHYIIPKFIDWNFGSSKYPQFKFGPFTDEQRNQVRALFSTMSTAASLQASPQFVFSLEKKMAEEIGLDDIDYEALEKDKEEEWKFEREQKLRPPEELAGAVAAATPSPQPISVGSASKKTAPKKAAKTKPKTVKASSTYDELVMDLAAKVLKDIDDEASAASHTDPS